jgi:hypothetical protein
MGNHGREYGEVRALQASGKFWASAWDNLVQVSHLRSEGR